MLAARLLRRALDGERPSSTLLRRLAPGLGLHAADLFVIAEAEVPDELAPLDASAGTWVSSLAAHAVRLSPGHRGQLRQTVASFPQHSRSRPFPPPKPYEQYPSSFEALLLRMLRNRNLGWLDSVKCLYALAGFGPWSAATLGAVGRGGKKLTPGLLVDVATVLAIPADTLAALARIDLPADAGTANPAAQETATLIWDVRRLTSDQIHQARDLAQALHQG